MIFYYFLLIILTLSCFYLVNKYKQFRTGRIKHFSFIRNYILWFSLRNRKRTGRKVVYSCLSPYHRFLIILSLESFIPSFPALPLNLKPVAYSPYGFNILRFGCIKLDLLTDLFNMNCNRSNISHRFHCPYFPEQFILCKDTVWISARNVRRSNSFVVKVVSSPFTHTRLAVLSILIPLISITSFFTAPDPTRRLYLSMWAFTLATSSLGLNGFVI